MLGMQGFIAYKAESLIAIIGGTDRFHEKILNVSTPFQNIIIHMGILKYNLYITISDGMPQLHEKKNIFLFDEIDKKRYCLSLYVIHMGRADLGFFS